MGLDMYLSAKRYMPAFDHNGPEAQKAFRSVVEAAGLADIADMEGAPTAYISTNVLYWRKANAIHAWFVENVQKGKDDCGTYRVSREQLQELLNNVKMEIGAYAANPAIAGKVLVPTSGFFFGSMDVDKWYLDNMKRTKVALENILSKVPEDDWSIQFEYHSSW